MWCVGKEIFVQTQITLQSKLSDEDSAHCTYNFEDCGYYRQECKSNCNCLPMQLTVNLSVFAITPFRV